MSTTAAARVMARGRHIELRLWERDPAGRRAIEPDEAHEHGANYVQAGALIVLIGDEPPLEVHAGDSYVVPAGLGCSVSRYSSRPSSLRRSARRTARTNFRFVYLRTWLTQRPVGVVAPDVPESTLTAAAALDAIDEGVLVQDSETHVVYANRAAGELLGVDREDLRGRSELPTPSECLSESGEALPERWPSAEALRTGRPTASPRHGTHAP